MGPRLRGDDTGKSLLRIVVRGDDTGKSLLRIVIRGDDTECAV